MDETEVKLDLHPNVDMPDLAGVVPDTQLTREPTRELKSVYYDTEDHRLIRAGVTLRHRSTDGDEGSWQVKLPLGRTGRVTTRRELEFPGSRRRPPASARDLVVAYTRTAPLQPVARLNTVRAPVRVLRDGQVVAEVDDDEVSVYDGQRLRSRFREVEVETGDKQARRAIVEALSDVGAERTDQAPKLVRALGPVATEPSDLDPPELPDPDPHIPVGQVVSWALLVDLQRMVHHDPGTRRGEDAEELHQMRVATRRLRTTLRTYRPVLDREWADHLRGELAAVARALGQVRDLDVLTARVDGDLAKLDEADRAAGEHVHRLLVAQRAEARERLLAVLDDGDYLTLLDHLVEAAHHPHCLDPHAPAGPALAPLVQANWRGLVKATKSAEHLHDIRLRIKRLRYAAEAVEPAFGKPATRLADRAGTAQDVLGAYSDAEVAIDRYRTLLTDAQPHPAFVLGQLTARAQRRKRKAARRWPDVWADLKRPKLRAFLDE